MTAFFAVRLGAYVSYALAVVAMLAVSFVTPIKHFIKEDRERL